MLVPRSGEHGGRIPQRLLGLRLHVAFDLAGLRSRIAAPGRRSASAAGGAAEV